MDALRFGRLLLVAFAERRKGQPYVVCKCDCGGVVTVALSSVRTGRTKSCGCLQRETKSGLRHGMTESRTYSIWCGVRQRCLNPNNPAYVNYGGRGIGIHPRWETFENFYADMGDAPEGKSLERVDNDKGYGPDNCVWADRIEQARNNRRCRRIAHKGQTKTLGEWADEYGLRRQTLAKRLDKGWPIERALTYSPDIYHNRTA